MAATTVKTANSVNHTGNGQWSARYYWGWMTYNVASTDSLITVTAYSGLGLNKDINTKFKITQTATGYTTKEGTIAVEYKDGSAVNKTVISTQTYKYSRTTSAQTKTLTVTAVSTNSDNATWRNTTLSKSVTISIPALPKYNVTFNVQGHGTAPATQSIYYGNKATQPSNPTATGYTFGGWYTTSSCTTAYNFSTQITANKTIYAKWTENSYTFTYNLNGGTFNNSTSNLTKSIKYTDTVTVGKTSNNDWILPTKDNYNFIGWASSATATSPSYPQAAGPHTLTNSTANRTFYAVWEPQYSPPKVSNLVSKRTNSDSDPIKEIDTGTYAMLDCEITQAYKSTYTWDSSDGHTKTVNKENLATSLTINIYKKGTTTPLIANYTLNDASEFTGPVRAENQSNKSIDINEEYSVEVNLTVNNYEGSSKTFNKIATDFISKAFFLIDVGAYGHAIAFGTSVDDENDNDSSITEGMWINLPIYFNQNIVGSSPQLTVSPTNGGTDAASIKVANDSFNLQLRLEATTGRMGIYDATTGKNHWICGYYPTENYVQMTYPVNMSSTLTVGGTSTFKNTLTVSGALLKVTNNSNTISIGSQNTSFCHVYNSASIPFIFNNSILSLNHNNLGSTTYYWANLYLSGKVYDTGGRKILKRVRKNVDNISIAGSSSVEDQFDITESGYTPIGIVGYDLNNASSSGTRVGDCVLLALRIGDSNKCLYQVTNNNSNAAKIRVYADILYIATSMA